MPIPVWMYIIEEFPVFFPNRSIPTAAPLARQARNTGRGGLGLESRGGGGPGPSHGELELDPGSAMEELDPGPAR